MLSSANSDKLLSPLIICVPLIFFSSLTVPCCSSNTALRKRDSQQPCLVSDFNGIDLSFLLFKMMLLVDLLYATFIMLRYVPSSPALYREKKSLFIVNGNANCWSSSGH